jgi:HNH endonuclease
VEIGKRYKSKWDNATGKTHREHRVIMAQALGRELSPSEVIHHKDGNKSNNAVDNLSTSSAAKLEG